MSAPDVFDVVIIGGGRAGSSVLLRLLNDQLDAGPLTVAVVDPHHRLGSGSVYSGNAGDSLIVTDLQTFFEPDELSRFERWLHLRGESAGGSTRAARDLHRSYVQRNMIGEFFEDEVEAALRASMHAGRVGRYRSTVRALHRCATGFQVRHRDGVIYGHSVVLAVGSRQGEPLGRPRPVVLDSHSPSTEHNRVRARTALAGRKDCSIGIVGTNASALETMYLLENDAVLREANHRYHLISRSGALPDVDDDAEMVVADVARSGPPQARTAAELYDALVTEIGRWRADGFGAHAYSPHLTTLTEEGLHQLPPEEKRCFMERYGRPLLRHRRKGGGPYAALARRLLAEGRLRVSSAHVDGCDASGMLSGLAADLRLVELGPFDLVIKCTGAPSSLPFSSCATVNGIDVEDLGLRWSATGCGLDVSETFEAAPGLFVHGPLLSGYVAPSLALLHLEDARAIRTIGDAVATEVLRRSALERRRAEYCP